MHTNRDPLSDPPSQVSDHKQEMVPEEHRNSQAN